MAKILYLHGFASSANSTKANLINTFIKKNTNSTKKKEATSKKVLKTKQPKQKKE